MMSSQLFDTTIFLDFEVLKGIDLLRNPKVELGRGEVRVR